MDQLSELMSTCNAANTDRVTERAKQIENLRRILTKSEVLKALDRHSALKAKNDKRNGQLFAWDNLFTISRKILEKEVEYLRKAKEAHSATVVTNREKKKHGVANLIKTVVKLADKRGQRNLKVEDVIQFIMYVLSDNFTCSSFGMDMSTLLLKNILSIRRYWAEIALKTWHDLMNRYCKLLKDPPPRSDRFVIARIIHVVTQGASQQCDIRGRKLLPIIETYFTDIRQESAHQVAGQMVSTLVVVCESLAVNGRVQVCRLGELLVGPLLFLWKRRSSELLKDRLVEFLHLQIRAHHPRGAASEADGAHAINWDQWKSDIKKIYEAIYSDLEEWTVRNKFSAGSRDVSLKDNYIDLAVDVCHQLFRSRTSVLDVTQAAILETQPGGATKRRRVESGWGLLTDSIGRHAKGLAIPWLQLIKGLVSKYPEDVPEEEAVGLLTSLHSVQTETKHLDTLRWTLRCLCALAHSQWACRKEWAQVTLQQTEQVWTKVWAATLRTLSLHQAETESYQLLSQCLEAQLVTPDTNLWSLFLPTICPVSQPALAFISHYLQHCDLHERYQPALLVTGDTALKAGENYPLRHQLIHWLFPETDAYGDDSVTVSVTAQKVDPQLLAETAVVLTLRDTRSICIHEKAVHSPPARVDFEKVYLQTSFDLVLDRSMASRSQDGGIKEQAKSSSLSNIQKRLLEVVARDSQSLIDSTDLTVSSVETIFWQCAFLGHVLCSFVSHSVMSKDEVTDNSVVNHLKQLMNRAASLLTELVRCDRSVALAGPVAALTSLFTCNCNSNVASVIVSLTPPKLLDLLLDLTKGKKQRDAAGGHDRSGDDLFDFNDNMDVDDVTMDDEHTEPLNEDEGFTSGTTAGCDSLLSRRLLTEAQHQQLETAQLLCLWTRLEAGESPGEDGDRAEKARDRAGDMAGDKAGDKAGEAGGAGSHRVIIEKLLDLLEDDAGWDASRPYDLQLLQTIIEELSTPGNYLEGSDLQALSVGLWKVGKAHRRDQEICALVIDLVTRLIPFLASRDSDNESSDKDAASSDIQEARETCLHLVGVFRKLSGELQFSHKTRLSIARCMAALLQADPAGQWAVWQQRGASGDEGNSRLLDEFPKLLQDPHHGIRLLAVANLHSLFVQGTKNGFRPKLQTEQDRMFEKIYITLTESMKIEGQHSEDEQVDEAVNRTSSLLHALAAIATSSAICEKKATFAFYQSVEEHQLDQDLVTKVLGQVAKRLSYPELLPFMTARLPYLLLQWLESGYTLSAFPCRLAGYPTHRDFYAGQYKVQIPVLIMRQAMEDIKMVARRLKADHIELIKFCLPKVIIHILPQFAMSSAHDRVSQRNHAYATQVYEVIVTTVQKETVEQCIMSHLDQIVVDILMTLSDPSCNLDPNGDRLEQPESNPPCFSKAVIRATLEYITKGHSTSAKTVVALLAKTPDGIQQVLLALHQAACRARCLYERRRVLAMYELFTDLLLAEFDTKLGGSFAFVLRDMLFTLLQVLQLTVPSSRTNHCALTLDIGNSCLWILKNVCNTAVNLGFEELGRFLPSIAGVLITYASQENVIGAKSLGVLQLLVVEHRVELEEGIRLLAPPPDKPPFTALHHTHHAVKYAQGPFSLKQELDHFVLAQRSILTPSGGTLEALHFLYDQLSTRKEQLASLVAEPEDSDGHGSLLAMVTELLHLTRSADEQLLVATARCLGELGPVDLRCVALPPRRGHLQLEAALEKYEGEAECQQYCRVLHLLDQYLIDPSVDVVTAASKVLKRLLSTKTGVRFYADYNSKMENALKYLHPFKATKKKVMSLPEQDHSEERFLTKIDQADLWVPDKADHASWVTSLVCALIDSGAIYDEVLLVLTEICKVKVAFCEEILPYLVHDVLAEGTDMHRAVISRHVIAFIDRHCQTTDESASTPGSRAGSRPASPLLATSGDADGHIYENPASVRVILNVIQYLRLQDRQPEGRARRTPWENNFWLDVDYLQVARASSSVSAYFTTLMYAEIWCNSQRETLGTQPAALQSSERSSQRTASQRSTTDGSQRAEDGHQGVLSQLDSLSGMRHDGGLSVQQLMLDAYRNLGDPDGVYGCGAGKLADTNARIQTYEHEGQWGKTVGAYDLLLSQPAANSGRDGLLKALQKLGMGHVLDTYLAGLAPGGLDMREMRQFQYEAAWRNGRWQQSTPTRFSSDCGYQECVYSSLWAIKENDTAMLEAATKQARFSCLAALQEGSVESVRSLYPVLSSLQCLGQIEDATNHSKSGDLSALLEKWQDEDSLLEAAYDYVEQPLLQRCRLLQLMPRRNPSSFDPAQSVDTALLTHLEQYARRSREAGRHQVAERVISELQTVAGAQAGSSLSWRVEEARLYWARGEADTAKHLMKGLLRRLKTSETGEASLLYPRCLGIYGNWLAETRSESPKVIMEDFLVEAVKLLAETDQTDESALAGYLSLGKYADVQYQQIVDYMASPTFEAKQALFRQAKSDAEGLRKMGEKRSRYLRTLDMQSAIDESEVTAMRTDKEHYLAHALTNYIKCLSFGDSHDLRIFRLTSLWFDNKDDAKTNKLIKAAVSRVKSYKFLPLMYQLAARMGSVQGDHLFPRTLEKLLERTATDHPHHTVAIILALANATKDDEYLPARGRGKAGGRLSRAAPGQAEDDEDRVKAAKALLARLKNSSCADIINDMERLSEAYIELANFDVEKYKKETTPIPMPKQLQLTSIKDLRNVAVATADIKVDPTCQYEDIVYVHGFKETFKLAGGINLPKIISCVGSDGLQRRQLVKGKDDLRQDAVMQQVFGMVNHLLSREQGTRGRHLLVRTYKVIPLSQRSGLLEWCEGTIPIGEYLIASRTGAHQRYRPQDLTAAACRSALAAAHDPKRDPKLPKKIEVYQSVCERFQPVFRHFFYEKFPDPTQWYQRHVAYTRSVATNSVVGYILGLGDRHVQNILIDCKTAELIHIDLGVAFEQGRILPTPETVPFRLTRDVVDGMGVTGVEGIFRRCCECTMEVLRGSGEALLTILTVLLYDPLYAWTISPLKACALQSRRESRNDPEASYEGNTTTHDLLEMAEGGAAAAGSEPVNKMAERVLLRLRQKLAGLEHGVHLSASGHVNLLIQEATDPHNLCRLYPGWQPYI